MTLHVCADMQHSGSGQRKKGSGGLLIILSSAKYLGKNTKNYKIIVLEVFEKLPF